MSPIFDRNVPGSTEVLQRTTVGIAGCGGLGSNVALSLTRAGVGRLVLVDHDWVEESNLNRQQYFLEDVGRKKVEALAARLRAVNPAIEIEAHDRKLTPEDVVPIFRGADVLIEAFDRAESKAWLVEAWCRAYPKRLIVVASGLSGLGETEAIRARQCGHLVVCGDETSDMSQGLCAPRVAIAANMQANVAVEWLVRGRNGG